MDIIDHRSSDQKKTHIWGVKYRHPYEPSLKELFLGEVAEGYAIYCWAFINKEDAEAIAPTLYDGTEKVSYVKVVDLNDYRPSHNRFKVFEIFPSKAQN